MIRTVLVYGVLLALGAFALEWWEYQHVTRIVPTGGYVVIIALAFVALGVWIGRTLRPASAPAQVERDERAIAELGLTAREMGVLELLACGQSNKEIARSLDVSPNTVKTHLRRVFEKLDVQNRTQAVRKAQELNLLP